MDNINVPEVEISDLKEQKRKLEKKAVRRVAAFVGLAYFILWLIPYIFSFALIDLSRRFGMLEQVLKFYDDPAILMLIQIGLSTVTFILPFLIVAPGTGSHLSNFISFGRPEKGTFLPLVLGGLGFCAFGNIATNAISEVFSSIGIEFSSPDLEYPQGFFGMLLVIIAIAVTPALVEEFAMRGVVMGSLKPFGEGFAIVVSAVIFGMVHGNFVQMPFAFIVGLALGYAVIKSKSVWTGIAIHFINNGVSVVLDYLTKYIDSVLIQNAVMLGYFALCFLGFFVALFLTRKKETEFWKLATSEMTLSASEKAFYFFFSPVIIIDIILTVVSSLMYVAV